MSSHTSHAVATAAPPDEVLPTGNVFLLPACGGAPTPPVGLEAALQLPFALRAQPPTIGEALRDDLRALPRAIFRRPYRARYRGLSRPQTRRWAAYVAEHLGSAEQAALVAYAQECRAWAKRLARQTKRKGAAADWTATPARNVALNSYEHRLGEAFTALGLPVQAQVGVSKTGGPRRGGWFRAYWLDWAHRDPDYLLRLDIEMDGKDHRRQDRAVRDTQRNDLLCQRGWYVLRVTSAAARRETAMQEIMAVAVERVRLHRQAIVLARSDVRLLTRLLAGG